MLMPSSASIPDPPTVETLTIRSSLNVFLFPLCPANLFGQQAMRSERVHLTYNAPIYGIGGPN
jgi:hypothetical protein